MFKQIMKHHILFWTMILVSCGTLVGNPEEEDDQTKKVDDQITDTQSQGLTFNIADAPVDGVQSLFITITAIEIKNEAGDWLSIPLVLEQEIDLLKYQDGESIKFAEISEIAAGVYNETRLILSETVTPRVVLATGKTVDLTIPGGESSGLKLKIPFTVEAGTPVDITLDFDIRRSLKIKGEGDDAEYSLSPVLRLLKHGEYGHVEGIAEEGKIVCVYPEDVQPDESDDCEHALNSAIVKDGKYKLPHLPKGKYKVQVFDKDGKVKHKDGEKDQKYDVEPVQYKDLKKRSNHGDEEKANELNDDGKDDEKNDDGDSGKNFYNDSNVSADLKGRGGR